MLAQQLELERGVEALRRGIVEARPDPSHRLGDPEPSTGGLEQLAAVLAAVIGVEDHTGDVAASDRGGHLQRGDGERGVVMLRHGEPGDPPRRQVFDVGEVQLALIGRDLGQVAAPLDG